MGSVPLLVYTSYLFIISSLLINVEKVALQEECLRSRSLSRFCFVCLLEDFFCTKSGHVESQPSKKTDKTICKKHPTVPLELKGRYDMYTIFSRRTVEARVAEYGAPKKNKQNKKKRSNTKTSVSQKTASTSY